MSTPKELRIHFDLSAEEYWHRKEWEQKLSRLTQGTSVGAVLTDNADMADVIIQSGGLPPPPAGTRSGPPRYVWDAGDLPSGKEPGFYCSLPRTLYDRRRHRTANYPICYNECVQPADPAETDHLVGFVGGLTSGIRARMLRVLRRDARPGECFLLERGGPWNQMFDRSGLSVKQDYASALRRSRFFLCPRGNGVGSVRFFETLLTGRVPVVISDDYVPPAGIGWSSCALFVKEREIDRLLPLLRERQTDWPALAANARHVWDAHYGDATLLRSLATGIHEIGSPPPPEKFTAPFCRTYAVGLRLSRRHLGSPRNFLAR